MSFIDYQGSCPNCDSKEFELLDEFGDTQWIRCRYCKNEISTENGELAEPE